MLYRAFIGKMEKKMEATISGSNRLLLGLQGVDCYVRGLWHVMHPMHVAQ